MQKYMPIKKVGKEPRVKGLPLSFAAVIAACIVISVFVFFALMQTNMVAAIVIPVALTVMSFKVSFKILGSHGENPIKSIISGVLRKSIRFDDPQVFKKL